MASERVAGTNPFELVALAVSGGVRMPIVPAARRRAWMDATDRRFANRCLPMVMANQAGWEILSTHDLQVRWNGGATRGALNLEWTAGEAPYPADSHFGHGILTWRIPYLFRTEPGWELLARGPANRPKDGVAALEGLVETDWAVATFTMNWKLTRPHVPVTFERGEPICMVVPQRRHDLERFRPRIAPLDEDEAAARGYRSWLESRTAFNAGLARAGAAEAHPGWQRDYTHGRAPGGERAGAHRTQLRLSGFEESGVDSAQDPGYG